MREKLLFILYKNYNHSLTTLEITIAIASMADKQGKTIRHRLSQFILVWVRCHVAVDKYFLCLLMRMVLRSLVSNIAMEMSVISSRDNLLPISKCEHC